MTTLILATWAQTLVAIGIVMVSLLLIGLILLQKNKGAGLSGAFGGVGGHTAFGTKTGDFLTWLTVGLAGAFLLLAVVGNYVFTPAPLIKKSIETQDQGAAVPGDTSTIPADAGTAPVQVPVNPAPATGGSAAPTTPVSPAPAPAPAQPSNSTPPPASTPPGGTGGQ